MSLVFPQTFADWYLILPALVTLLLGLCYFFFPGRVLKMVGLEGTAAHPEAIGEARSSFAGFLLGTAVVVVMFQQSGLYAMLGLAWGVAALGLLMQMVFDGRRSRLIILRFVIAVILCAASLDGAGGLESYFNENMLFQPPATPKAWLPLVSAGVAFAFGLVCLVSPKLATAMMRLQKKEIPEGGHADRGGEPRGVLAGFYLVVGGSALLFALFGGSGILSGIIFLTLAICWGLVAFGRMIAMLSDRANNGFNWLSLLLEIVLSALAFMGFSGFLI